VYANGGNKVKRSETNKKQFLKSKGLKSIPKGYEIDHITPLSFGGSDCPDNMQLITVEEHRKKTAKEALQRDRDNMEIELANLFGGYSVGAILENNVTTDEPQAKLYFSRGSLGFQRNGADWKFCRLSLKEVSKDYYLFTDNYNQQIIIDKEFRFVTFLAENQTYNYTLLKKDLTIKQPF